MKNLFKILFVALILFGCEEEINVENDLKDEASRRPVPIDYNGLQRDNQLVSIQIQASKFEFGEEIEVAYAASNVERIEIFLKRRRNKLFYNSIMNSYFDSRNNNSKPDQIIHLGTITLSGPVGSGIVEFQQPNNLYYDNSYILEARVEGILLSETSNFEIGSPNLTLIDPPNNSTITEQQKDIIKFSSNMDPSAFMIIEIISGTKVKKRFISNNISDSRQTWEVKGLFNVHSGSLVGKLSSLNLSYMNSELALPPADFFSGKYDIKIYPYGYSNISSKKTNINLIEEKYTASDPIISNFIGEFTVPTIGNTCLFNGYHTYSGRHLGIGTANYNWFPRFDLYKNGQWFKRLGADYELTVVVSDCEINTTDRWDVRLSVRQSIDSNNVPIYYDMKQVVF